MSAPSTPDPQPGTPTLNTGAIPLPSTDTLPSRGGVDSGSAPPAPALPTRPGRGDGSRFRTLRPLGKGGLGEVSVAQDQELNREIALKEVQAQHLDNADSVGRFLREAEVTGRLEHPGVVPVYSLGAYADGRPYYAMRLIRGEDFQKAIDHFHKGEPSDSGERRVAFRNLLRRFVDVCNAVAYAHSRGVLHRDLKPANVMLGPFGETLVIDWGLARVSGAADADAVQSAVVPSTATELATQEGSIVGTPAYMSPEQAAGRTVDLGPSSDVYSLGCILYVLLTGRTPFGKQSLMEVLANVRLGRFPPPRQVSRTVSAALEAICLKAMALQPGERYGSAHDLAADVEHWVADEPVTAYREPLTERVRRWGRRHRTLVTSLGVLLLSVTTALAVGLFLVNREKDRTTAAEGETRRALERVTQEQGKTQEALERVTQEQGKTQQALNKVTLEQGKTQEALGQVRHEQAKTEAALKRSQEAEKSAAEQRQLAVETVRLVADDIDTQLKNRPDLQELRKTLLKRVLDGLKKVARAADTANQADHETIWAHLELGDIFLNLEAGGTQEAAKQYQLAHALARSLAEKQPRNAEAQRDLSASLSKVGDVQLQQGEGKAALDSYEESLEVARTLAKADPNNAQAQRDLSVALNRVGNVQLRQGEGKAALASYTESLEIARTLAKADPNNAQAQRDLSVSLIKVGDVQLQQGDGKAALDSSKEALEIARTLAKLDPNNAEAQRDLSVSMIKVGDVQLQQGDGKAALDSSKEALEIARTLAKLDLNNTQAQRDLSVSMIKVGDVQLQQGDGKAALDSSKEALEIARTLAKLDLNNTQAQRDLSVSLIKVGDVQLQQGEGKAALASYKEALDIRRTLAKADPYNAETQRDLFVSLSKVGDVQLQQGDGKAAFDAYKEALEINRKRAKADPNNAQAQRDLSVSLNRVGEVQLRQGEGKAALDSYKEALEIARTLAKADPNNAQAQRDLIASHFKLGKHAQTTADFATALRSYEEGRRVAQAFHKPEIFEREVRSLDRRLVVCRAAQQRQELDRAVTAADKLAETAKEAGPLYDAARAFARCVPLADTDATREKHAVRAVALLRQAIAKGYKDVDQLKTDADLNPLRPREDFRRLLRELEAKMP